MQQYHSYIIGFLATAALIYFLRSRAAYFGLIDSPCKRKQHSGNIPLIGGLAIFCGFIFASFTLDEPLVDLYTFLAACLTVIVVGVLDDVFDLSTWIRFVAQIAAALIMSLWGGVILLDLGVLSFDGSLFSLGILAIPFTVFATVGVINTLNMSDGLDGLSGALTLSALSGLIVVAYTANAYVELNVLLLLTSCIVAFLFFNLRHPLRKQASIFMGDAGSMFIGFSLTWFFIKLSQGEQRAMPPVAALWFIALPLFDTVGIMFRRIIKGRSPFLADREHFHHILLLAGCSVAQSVAIMTVLSLIGVAIGLTGIYLEIPDIIMFALFLAMFSVYYWGMMHTWKVMRFLSRSICRRRNDKDRRVNTTRRISNITPETERRVSLDRRSPVDRRSYADLRGFSGK
ncbi:MAG TPA: undecaprenyl/decaprenyl-phosphate alpha-N-acetylglucosaminyl 1-phosphate transferase [Gammaproteobacteria bacterium]|nr:undecaprenyl/decaprenyl-phosphate alpha-N-acetylglucosaminyl 1-phosphate transferase [Gammaproteobacteria bacterium]